MVESTRNRFARKSERIVYSTDKLAIPEEIDVELEKISHDEARKKAHNGEFDEFVFLDGYDPETGQATGGVVGYIFE